jgi:Glycosyl hydrolases family 16
MQNMSARSVALGAAVIVVVLTIAVAAASGTPIASPGASASSPASSIPSLAAVIPSIGVVPTPPSPYTFDDEFGGSGLDPVWAQHFSCCGQLAGIDPSLAVVSNGMLSLGVGHRADGWYGSLIDTEFQWSQQYGHFAARIKVPAGTGLWPAFWGYASGGGPQSEIDTMEVCPGSATATALHTSVHWSGRGSDGHVTQTVDLSQDFHVYAVDWRADHVTFSLDGNPVWTFTDASHIPHVALPLILDLGVNGDFCGPADATTPTDARMLVDWVRVEP